MSGEALSAEHNGDIWSREATKHDAILAGKKQRFLSDISILFYRPARAESGEISSSLLPERGKKIIIDFSETCATMKAKSVEFPAISYVFGGNSAKNLHRR